jgi:membrane protein implicated in regulation of membrane protease activity
MIWIGRALAFGAVHWKALSIVLALLAVFAAYKLHIRAAEQRGEQRAIERIERANEVAGSAADKAERAAVDCALAGRKWNREAQTCE